MTNRILVGVWALVAPVIALAQQAPSNSAPVTPESSLPWGWIIALVAVVALASLAYRALRANRGPHGPQAPTPRGP